jgi:hypothetical protein
MYKDRDINWKNCFKVIINVIYFNFNQEKTPLTLPQVKGKGKAQPYTIRLTLLFNSLSLFNNPLIILTSDLLEEEEYDSNEVSIEKEQALLLK